MELEEGLGYENDEEDTFHCGRCKSRFTSLSAFICHKEIVCCRRKPASASSQHSAPPFSNSPGKSFSPISTLYHEDQAIELSRQRDTHRANSCTELTPFQTTLPSTPAAVFRAIVLSENETLTFDIPLDQFQFPPGYVVQSVRQDGPVLSAPDSELTTLTSLLHAEPEHGPPHLPSSSEPISISPIFQTTGKDSCYYPDSHLVNLQYLNDGTSCIVLNTSSSELSTHEMHVTPVQLSESPVFTISSSPPVPESSSNASPAPCASEPEPLTTIRSEPLKLQINQPNCITNNSNTALDRAKLKCRYCGKHYRTSSLLDNHLRSHAASARPSHKCPLCERAFTLKSNLRKHLNIHKVWPKIKCTLPNERASSNNTEESMKSEVMNQYCGFNNVYECQYCNKRFASFVQLKSHMKLHKEEKIFKCVVVECGKTFSDVGKLISHSKTHTFQCESCPEVFWNLKNLHSHEAVVHRNLSSGHNSGTALSNLQCTKCRSKFKSSIALEHHLLASTHNYPCTHAKCPLFFHTERYLRRHLKLHTSVKDFNCSMCQKSFKTEAYLKVHLLTHSKVKSFKCEQCETLFGRKDILTRHIKTVHQQRVKLMCPFKDICTKEFYRKDKLQDHVWSHSKKVYVCNCDSCEQSFLTSTQLRHHQIAVHPKIFVSTTCSNCDKIFKTKHHLKIHVCKRKSDAKSSTCSSSKNRSEDACTQSLESDQDRTETADSRCDIINLLDKSASLRKCSKKLNYVLHHMQEEVPMESV